MASVMNVDEYVAARYGRLLERAVVLGAPEGSRPSTSTRCCSTSARRSGAPTTRTRSCYAALERAVLRLPRARRSPWPFVGVGLVGIAVAVAVVLTQDPVTEPMPALFGYTGEQAQELLEDDGLRRRARGRSASASRWARC